MEFRCFKTLVMLCRMTIRQENNFTLWNAERGWAFSDSWLRVNTLAQPSPGYRNYRMLPKLSKHRFVK